MKATAQITELRNKLSAINAAALGSLARDVTGTVLDGVPSYSLRGAAHGMSVIFAEPEFCAEVCAWLNNKGQPEFSIVFHGRVYDVGQIIGEQPDYEIAVRVFDKLCFELGVPSRASKTEDFSCDGKESNSDKLPDSKLFDLFNDSNIRTRKALSECQVLEYMLSNKLKYVHAVRRDGANLHVNMRSGKLAMRRAG